MAISGTEKLNWFPAKHDISNTFTPHQMLELKPIDFDKELKICQGSCCQAHSKHTIKNDLKQHTLDKLSSALILNIQ